MFATQISHQKLVFSPFSTCLTIPQFHPIISSILIKSFNHLDAYQCQFDSPGSTKRPIPIQYLKEKNYNLLYDEKKGLNVSHMTENEKEKN